MSTKATKKPKPIELREGEWDDNGCPVSLIIRVTPEGTFGRAAGDGGGWYWCAGITGKPGAFGSGRAENAKAGLRKARQCLATALEAAGRLMERVSVREEAERALEDAK
jgi:hypothetical protein